MPAGTAGMSAPGLTLEPQNLQAQIAACTHAASSGDVAALQLLSDGPASLDSCLEALIAEAIPKGHLNILQDLATHIPAGQAPSLISFQTSLEHGTSCG